MYTNFKPIHFHIFTIHMYIINSIASQLNQYGGIYRYMVTLKRVTIGNPISACMYYIGSISILNNFALLPVILTSYPSYNAAI